VNRTRRTLIIAAIALVALTLAVPTLFGLLTDWWWFKEIGYQVVFTGQLVTRVVLFLVVGAVTAGTLYANLRIAQRGIVPHPIVVAVGPSSPSST